MALNNVVNIGVSVSDFKSSVPNFYKVFNATNNQNQEVPTNALFSEKITSFDLGTTNYGYIEFDITYTGTSEYSSISFGVPNIDIINADSITYGYNLTDPFDALYGFDIIDNKKTIHSGLSVSLKNNVKQKIYLIVNLTDNFKYQVIQIYTTIGLFNNTNPSTNHNFKIEYNCVEPLFKYDVGLHVYSPYDAIESTARLTTILASQSPVSSWVTGTKVYSDPGFTRPALPYYYGISNKVYKVGGPFSRYYGTKTKFLASQSNFSEFMKNATGGNYWNADVTEVTMGPSYWDNTGSIDACVNPIMTKVGIITEIILTSKLPKPLGYQYYMGYSPTNKQSTNDNFFVRYIWKLAKKVPVVGSKHAIDKLIKGYVLGIDSPKKMDINITGTFSDLKTTISVASVWLINITGLGGLIDDALSFVADKWWNIFPGGQPLYTKISTTFQSFILPTILSPLMIYLTIQEIFKWSVENLVNKNFVFEEDCTALYKVKNSNPYIFTGDTIYTQEDYFQEWPPFSNTWEIIYGEKTIVDGYFCDGIYFYTQIGETVTVKEVVSAYSFNGLDDNDGITTRLIFSNQPDNPTYVVTGYSLISLPYISGVPVAGMFDNFNFDFEIFYNLPQSSSFTPDSSGDLETNNIGDITLKYSIGTHIGYNSQTEVDLITTDHIDTIGGLVTGTTIDTYNFSEPLTGFSIGNIATIFTHEIRIEDVPNENMIYFDNQDGLGVLSGKTFYQDITGRVKSFDGYYAITGGTYYRTFYKLSGSTVVDIFNMNYSGSTTVTGLTSNILSVITDRLDFTSDWFYYDLDRISLLNNVNIMYNEKIPDITTLYGQDYIKRGYSTSGQTSFYTYLTNVGPTTGTTESLDGWYKPLIGWIINSKKEFPYSAGKTIQIDIQESCSTGLNFVDPLLGFYVVGNVSGSLSPLYDFVRLNTDIYVDNMLTQSYGITSSFYDAKTFISYSGLTENDNVTNITITSIDVDNVKNKYTYITGSFINCNNI
jgi:hypothetical protein